MTKKRKPYTFFQKASSIFLMLTLLWLTVSTPFIITLQQNQERAQNTTSIDLPVNDGSEDANDSSGNNVEEKAPNTSFSEEFLHEHPAAHFWFTLISRSHTSENAGIYIAFHGELHAPPPNAA